MGFARRKMEHGKKIVIGIGTLAGPDTSFMHQENVEFLTF